MLEENAAITNASIERLLCAIKYITSFNSFPQLLLFSKLKGIKKIALHYTAKWWSQDINICLPPMLNSNTILIEEGRQGHGF